MDVRTRIWLILTWSAFLIAAVGCTKGDETKSTNDLNLGLKDAIFIDDAQADAVEGSAVAGEFSDIDDEASGMGPDDEDAFEGSGEGSGAGGSITFKESNVYSVGVPAPKKPIPAPIPEPTRKTEHTARKDTAIGRSNTQFHFEVTQSAAATQAAMPSTTTTMMPNEVFRPGANDLPPSPGKIPPPPPQTTVDKDAENRVGDGNTEKNGIHIMGRQADEQTSSFFNKPGILAAVIGGAVVGLLCAILLVMFIVYRMRKKDEGKDHGGYEQGKPFDWKRQGNWPLKEKC